MTLCASVACDCFDDGLGEPCPINVEEDGVGRLYPPSDATEEELERFDDWVENGCDHEGHRFVWEEISNWSDLDVITKILDNNIDAFPALRESLGGSSEYFNLTPPDLAARAVAELDAFDLLCETDPVVPKWMPSVARRFRKVFEASVALGCAVVWD